MMTKVEAKHMSEVLKAYSEGKTIQFYNKYIDEWEDKTDTLFNNDVFSYRVKPEPTVRPYKNKEEFMKDMNDHGMYIAYDKYGYNMITQVNEDGIWINIYKDHKEIKFDKLVNYNWMDGTPCCVIE